MQKIIIGFFISACIMTAFAIPSAAQAGGLGSWQSGFDINTQYTASTDGFVVVTSTEGGDQDCNVKIESPVGVLRLQSSPNHDGVQVAETAPVRRGDSWRVVYTNTGCGTTANGMLKIFWIPFDGNLGQWSFGGYATNQSYTAVTDGFVVVTSTEGGDQDCNVVIETPVGTTRLQSSPNSDGVQIAETSPVRKGDSWRVRYTNTGCGTTANGMLKIFWIPFDGNLGQWSFGGYATNQSYTAVTDGFVVVTSTEGGDQDCNVKIESPVGVLRLQSSPNHDGVQVAETAPVRRGDSWRVVYTNTGCGTTANGMLKIFWISYSPPTGTIIAKAKIDGVEQPVSFGESYTPPGGTPTVATMNLPATFPNMPAGTWKINSVTPPAGMTLSSISGCGTSIPCSATLAPGGTLEVTYKFARVATSGTIIEKATLDGKPWDSPPFAVTFDASYGSNITVSIDPEQVIPAMPAGAYTLKGVTAPPGVTLKDVNGGSLPYSFTLAPDGTITLVHNFVTPPPTTGTLQIRATKDGQPWDSQTFPVNMSLPGGSVGDISVNPPQDIADSLLGAYQINGVTSPPGVTFQNVNGSSLPYSRALSAGGTLVFTLNFTTTVVTVPTLVVTPSSASMQVGGNQQFTAVYDPDGSGPQFPLYVTNYSGWSSSNNSVASVSSTGVANGKSAGSATITASYSGLTASALLTVTAPTPTLVVTPASWSLAINDSKQFKATYDPDGSGSQPSQDVTDNVNTIWSPSDATKVTVSKGLATRVGNGYTSIRASYLGTLSNDVPVTDPATIRVSPSSKTLDFGATVQLSALYDPDGAGAQSAQDVTSSANWSSSAPTRAAVDNTSSKGLVTAGSTTTGVTYISASYQGLVTTGSNRATITVTAPALAVSCSASPTETTTGQSVIWTAVASGGTGSYTYQWSGSSPLNGKTGNPVAIQYTTIGTKTGDVMVTSGGQVVSQPCATSVTVKAPLPPPTATLSADPEIIDKGQSSMLTWSSTNADSCTAMGGFDTGGATSGSVSVSPSTTSDYQVSCTGPGGSVDSNVATVTVVSVTASISASPSCVQGGGNSKITWSAAPSAHVASCTVSGPGLSSSQVSGSQTVNVTSKSTYDIACQTISGSTITKQVIVDTVGCFAEF